MNGYILDPNLAKRWQAMFPQSEGNAPGVTPAPVAQQIVPTVVLNPSTLIPFTKSGILVVPNFPPGLKTDDVLTIPSGFHLIVTYMSFFKSAGNDQLVSVKDNGTIIWDIGLVTTTTITIAPIILESLSILQVYGFTGAGSITYNFSGYLERISNL